MARPLRLAFPGGLYHVTARGNGRQAVFEDGADRERFLRVLESAITRYHVLWIHDYRGIDAQGDPDEIGLLMTTEAYLKALTAAVRAYDRRRNAIFPYRAQRNVARFGTADEYGWGEEKARERVREMSDRLLANPVIESLIYIGGEILDSVRSSYKERLGPSLDKAQVLKMMEEQHQRVVGGEEVATRVVDLERSRRPGEAAQEQRQQPPHQAQDRFRH